MTSRNPVGVRVSVVDAPRALLRLISRAHRLHRVLLALAVLQHRAQALIARESLQARVRVRRASRRAAVGKTGFVILIKTAGICPLFLLRSLKLYERVRILSKL